MKHLLVLFLATFSSAAFAQSAHAIPEDKNPKDFYLSNEFCASKGLKPGEINRSLRVWNNLDEGATYQRVVDIRWYFSSPAEAAAYLKDNLAKESEHGDPVTTPVEIPGTTNLHEFTEGASQRDLNKALGLKLNMYYFLFTVKNCAAKVFVSSETCSLTDAAVIAKESARRLNAAIH